MGISGDPDRPLLDREPELAGIERAFREVVGGHGRCLVCEGPAGSGKTVLLRHARRLAAAAGLTELRGAGGELERGYPFGVCRQLLEPAVGRADDARRAALLAGPSAPAAAILGLDGYGPALSADGYAAVHALYRLITRLAAERPLLITVDDAHWADPSSLRALDYLARRLDGLPVALVIALRPQEPGAPAELLDGLSSAAAVRLSTGPLSPAAITALVRERFPDAGDTVCAAWYETCGGNPLYALELVRVFAEGAAVPDAEAVRSASVRSLGERVLRRADQVVAGAPGLVRAMAVLGDGGRLETAAHLAGTPRGAAGTITHELVRIEVLAAEDPLAFVHPLIRTSIYQATPARDRHRMHRAAAQWLSERHAPATAVATHLRAVPPGGDSAVAAALLAAAEEALGRAAPEEAVGWLERAVAEQAPDPPRARLLARLGVAHAVRRDPACIALLQEAHELTDEAGERGRLAALLAEVCAQAGLWEQCMTMIALAERDTPAGDDELTTEVAAIRAAATLFDPQRRDEFRARRDGYRLLAKGDSWGAHALAALLAAEAAHAGQLADAIARADDALAGGRLLTERGAGAWAVPQVLGALIEADDYVRADAALDAVQAAAETSGATMSLLSVHAFRGWAHARRGDLNAAAQDTTAAFALARDSGMPMWITTGAFLLIDVLLERTVDPAVVALVETTELDPAFMATASGAMINEARGALALRAGNRARAVACLSAAGEIYAALGFGPVLSSWRSALAVALPGSDRERGRSLAAEELALARAAGLARAEGIALRAVGMLAADVDSALDALGASVAVLTGSPARLELARSLVELGSTLRRANRRLEAREPLAAAIDLAGRCGAERLLTRAREELRAAGGRRRRDATSGPEALTPGERRVVALAAAGVSNAEIGDQLFVSLKTVETHLSRAYAKLGLAGAGSRARLADVLAQAGETSSRS